MEIFIYTNEQNMLPPPDLEAEIERLQDDLIIERERYLRAQADFRNYRRRIENDVLLLVEASRQGMTPPLLNIIDDLQKICIANNLGGSQFI